MAEVDAALSRHRRSSSQTPVDILSDLSIDSWEKEFPLLSDGCLPEAIRLTMRGTPFRRNLGVTELPLGQDSKTAEVIPPGSYAAYLVHQVHFDPGVYTDPDRFDPERFEDHRAEHKKVPHGYLGWGSGMHPCCERKLSRLFPVHDFKPTTSHGFLY